MRKYVPGALYQQLYDGNYALDVTRGMGMSLSRDFHFELLFSVFSGETIQQLGVELESFKGNCRRHTGNLGDMFEIGVKSNKHANQLYKISNNEQVVKASDSVTSKVRSYLEQQLPALLQNLDIAESNGPAYNKLSFMNGMGAALMNKLSFMNGMGAALMMSHDLGNSAHFDLDGTSESCSFWVEKDPGNASNWFLIFPNIMISESSGLRVKLFHGRLFCLASYIITACPLPILGPPANHVYGCWIRNRKYN
jgi:hypothetical protein